MSCSRACIFLFISFLINTAALAQHETKDSTLMANKEMAVIDTTIDYDALFRDFSTFLDSILSPHSYFLANLSVGKGYYQFEEKDNARIVSSSKLAYIPAIGYFHKSGWGINLSGAMVHDGEMLNWYQTALRPSFDYLKNKSLATGISLTRFFTKDDLPFYTTPLQNEVAAYFMYRKSWLRPSVAVSYGWGNRSDYKKRLNRITDLRLRRRGYIFINTEESISDFSMTTSISHNFYWLGVFSFKDYIRLAPQISFETGTQKFGFNRSKSIFLNGGDNTTVFTNPENIYLDETVKFQPLSLTCNLRGEYTIGKFYIQPQFILDYYFPAPTDRFTTYFQLNLGAFL
ncbi:MAG: hypothetical protein KDC06_00825 [Chitinophagaceae bacterium]|nr:hypothetical protein [Chitinophagaceae bacterium]